MVCTECQSNNRRVLKMETMIHHANFPEWQSRCVYIPYGLDLPGLRIVYVHRSPD
jgi:hypothetical protein